MLYRFICWCGSHEPDINWGVEKMDGRALIECERCGMKPANPTTIDYDPDAEEWIIPEEIKEWET